VNSFDLLTNTGALKRSVYIFLFVFLLAGGLSLSAQRKTGADILQNVGNRIPGAGAGMGDASGSDSLQARDKFEDSVTLTTYFIDSVRGLRTDTSIAEFTKRFPIPSTHIYLGNTGSATRSILFAPAIRAGFDPGFHALDVYKWRLDKIRFYNTTRPYTELVYVLASRAEQMIEVFHTQNLKPYWNASFNYRLINAPGVFRNQTTNHNNYAFTSWAQSKNKRYNNYFVILGRRKWRHTGRQPAG
jgi:hypothetical protein